jgi:hypothetical protein
MGLVFLRFLLELGFCFMTGASVPPINDQSSAATVRSELPVIRPRSTSANRYHYWSFGVTDARGLHWCF